MKQQLLKVFFICMAVALLPQTAHAAGDVKINATNFPDATFRNYLLIQDYGKDGKLTKSEIENVKSLDLSFQNIGSLKGIEYFTALTNLDCSSNHLTSLDVSKNIALTNLNCSRNHQLTVLDVSGCTALTYLECSYNQLTCLDISNNTALTELYCWGNHLTSLDVSKNIALTNLDCSNNQLTTLDVSGCIALSWLWCWSNQLTCLDISNNTALIDLICGNNQLTVIDVSRCTALTGLSCNSNQLTYLDVSNNAALTGLGCYCNQIKGTSMDALINSLPTIDEPHKLSVYSSVASDEGNVCTKEQVKAAKEKGWIVLQEWADDVYGVIMVEYEGSDDMPSGINDIRTEAGKDAPVYNLRGQRLTAPQKGINIIDGRKVVVK